MTTKNAKELMKGLKTINGTINKIFLETDLKTHLAKYPTASVIHLATKGKIFLLTNVVSPLATYVAIHDALKEDL